jgi:hypothetical protein
MLIVIDSAVATMFIAADVKIDDENEMLWPRLEVIKHVLNMLVK